MGEIFSYKLIRNKITPVMTKWISVFPYNRASRMGWCLALLLQYLMCHRIVYQGLPHSLYPHILLLILFTNVQLLTNITFVHNLAFDGNIMSKLHTILDDLYKCNSLNGMKFDAFTSYVKKTIQYSVYPERTAIGLYWLREEFGGVPCTSTWMSGTAILLIFFKHILGLIEKISRQAPSNVKLIIS